YAAKSSRTSPLLCWSAPELGLRSQTEERDASFSAKPSVSAPGAIRQRQLPSGSDGVFMRASLPRPSTSCMGTIASLATEENAARIKAQCIPSSAWPKKEAAWRLSSSLAELSHQPSVVSLSWVPV